MQQPFGKFLMFQNRLEKVYRHLAKQARRQGITCFRIYDHDLPEFPLRIEVYEDKLYIAEYKRQHTLSDEAHQEWWQQSLSVIESVTGISEDKVYQKVRKRKENRLDQYQKNEEAREEFVVQEAGLRFWINGSDYLDTGLFLDHRITRGMVRERAKGLRVLNLFCYTASFSVYALAGGASKVTSVDLSKTYLAWAERNVALNFEGDVPHEVVHADVLAYLKRVPRGGYDLIIMDPPTFSNSKRMADILDVQRDHATLINDCISILSPGGVLYFSTNYTKFVLDDNRIRASEIRDITKATTPFDFAGKLARPCFKITK